ncbi:alpha/beta hydrolase [Aquimarina sp. 2-A2]|uniref:alpha/beta hydrolase n=1 Tax=Aquimarina sp. 2-A2 TaxID=3382644 RepID=UPI00387F287A
MLSKSHSVVWILVLLITTLGFSQSNEVLSSEALVTKTNHGTLIKHPNLSSQYIDARTIEVFLPTGYSDTSTPYGVLYVHDGQNVFNAKTADVRLDWGLDEILDSLLQANVIKNTLVVAIWNNGAKRFSEYMPKAPAVATENPEARKALLQKTGYDKLYSDDYLKFIVTELKPFIDSTYNTATAPKDTAIMGASMGGLISLHALTTYPHIFGAAACLSTHWPVPFLGNAYINTLTNTLPDPTTHKLYFDYGTLSLDAQYEPYQLRVNEILKNKGYKEGVDFISKKFEGASHNIQSWNARIHIPIEFILKK